MKYELKIIIVHKHEKSVIFLWKPLSTAEKCVTFNIQTTWDSSYSVALQLWLNCWLGDQNPASGRECVAVNFSLKLSSKFQKEIQAHEFVIKLHICLSVG